MRPCAFDARNLPAVRHVGAVFVNPRPNRSRRSGCMLRVQRDLEVIYPGCCGRDSRIADNAYPTAKIGDLKLNWVARVRHGSGLVSSAVKQPLRHVEKPAAVVGAKQRVE